MRGAALQFWKDNRGRIIIGGNRCDGDARGFAAGGNQRLGHAREFENKAHHATTWRCGDISNLCEGPQFYEVRSIDTVLEIRIAL